jgi:hypothetical protein
MSAKKAKCPEKNVDTGELVDLAKQALEARAKAAEFTTQEKKTSEEIVQKAEHLRRQEIEKENNYYGLIRITQENQSPVRVEFRFENGALDVAEESNLDTLYRGSRPVLFKREEIITEITDPLALIQELVNEGKNPFDYLKLSVREGMDRILVNSNHVTSAEAFLPTEGFLNTIDGIKSTLSEDAKTFTKNYLESALKPRVVLGTKGKS